MRTLVCWMVILCGYALANQTPWFQSLLYSSGWNLKNLKKNAVMAKMKGANKHRLVPASAAVLNSASKQFNPVPVVVVPPPVQANGCSQPGQFLPNPANQCGYFECQVSMNDPWADAQGILPLQLVSRPCGPGSGVAPGYAGGTTNPCTRILKACGFGTITVAPPVFVPQPGVPPVFVPPPPGVPPPPIIQPPPGVPPPPIFIPPPPILPTPAPPFFTAPPPPVQANGCQLPGDYRPSPDGNRCVYLECVYAEIEPWPTANGVIPLNLIQRFCAPGSAVPFGYAGGRVLPCSSTFSACKANINPAFQVRSLPLSNTILGPAVQGKGLASANQLNANPHIPAHVPFHPPVAAGKTKNNPVVQENIWMYNFIKKMMKMFNPKAG